MYVNYFKLVYYVIPALQFLHEIQNPKPTINFKAQNQWKRSTYFVIFVCSCRLYIEKERFYAVTTFTPREK